ncbi:MAG: tetratricopeptide repeat protein [Planctomycetia bacterium]|nr:tetratricopeptide repeat protein [Planctomycetia bacterium]
MKADKINRLNRNTAVYRTIVFLFISVFCCSMGCRSIPFYRMTNKASQGLILSREGITAYEHGDLDLAEKKLKEAVDLNKTDIEAQRYYAETLWQGGKEQEALDVLQAAIKKKGSQDNELILNQTLGEKLLLLHRPEEAFLCGERMIYLDPKKFEGWIVRANACWQLGKKEEALADYQRGLYLSPDNRDILWQLAHLQNSIGSFDRALATWQHLGRLYPVNTEPPEVLYGKAEAYYHLKRHQDAAENLQLAIKLSPDKKEYYRLLSNVWLEKGDISSALTVAAQMVERAPQDPESLDLYRKIEQIRLAAIDRENKLR